MHHFYFRFFLLAYYINLRSYRWRDFSSLLIHRQGYDPQRITTSSSILRGSKKLTYLWRSGQLGKAKGKSFMKTCASHCFLISSTSSALQEKKLRFGVLQILPKISNLNSVPRLVLETALSSGVSTPEGLKAAVSVLAWLYKNFSLFEMQ